MWFLANAFSSAGERIKPRPAVKALVIVLLIVLNSIVFMGTYLRLEIDKHPIVTMYTPAPDFQWTAFDGSSHRSGELKDHAVVLHFWASWCGPCRQELPSLIRFARKRPDILFIAFDSRDDRDKAEQFVMKSGGNIAKKDPPNLLYAWDPDSMLSDDTFKVASLPSSIFIDLKGIMRVKLALAVQWDTFVIEDFVQSK
jgi:thiol-disulfide isomerase/thioredoxin